VTSCAIARRAVSATVLLPVEVEGLAYYEPARIRCDPLDSQPAESDCEITRATCGDVDVTDWVRAEHYAAAERALYEALEADR
jgi:hypothetical protein